MSAQSPGETAIRKILYNQHQQGNAGKIISFMEAYWKSDSLVFIGKRGVTYGWRQTLDNYTTSYPEAAAMGLLATELVEVKHLSEAFYFVVGKWHVTRSTGDVNGAFTCCCVKATDDG